MHSCGQPGRRGFALPLNIYVVTDCDNAPRLQAPISEPARLDWNKVTKMTHFYLAVNALAKPMSVRQDSPPCAGNRP